MLLRLAPIFLCLLAHGCSSQPSISEAQKRTSLSWLQLIDNRAYEASWEALTDSVEYKLLKDQKK